MVEHLVKDYAGGGAKAVDGVSFTVDAGQFFTLLGPSGCGKTTTLRCVAGLERADEGRIIIGGKVVASDRPRVAVPAHLRGLGMVFQSYAIWPHMTVLQNVAFPLRTGGRKGKRMSRSEVRRRVEEALATVQLSGYEDRPATKLSGGQQQRLALARALVDRPRLLLLDEPLSNLDAKLRDHMRVELRSLQQKTGVTTLFVTHDQAEAFSMSNRIAVMDQGRVVQEGTPRQIYALPLTRFVADFVGRTNVLRGKITALQDRTVVVGTGVGVIQAIAPEGGFNAGKDTEVAVAIRPEDVHVRMDTSPRGTNDSQLSAKVERTTFLGESVEVEVRIGQELLLSRQHPACELRPGDVVQVELREDRCVLLL